MRVARSKKETLSKENNRHPLDEQHHIPFIIMIDFYESGKVKGGKLAKPKTITIHGIPYTFAGGWGIGFYESGKVEGGYVSKYTTVNTHGIPYTFHSFIGFYESGKVKGGGLSNPLTMSIGGKRCQYDIVDFE